jgi:hypothetical protein
MIKYCGIKTRQSEESATSSISAEDGVYNSTQDQIENHTIGFIRPIGGFHSDMLIFRGYESSFHLEGFSVGC